MATNDTLYAGWVADLKVLRSGRDLADLAIPARPMFSHTVATDVASHVASTNAVSEPPLSSNEIRLLRQLLKNQTSYRRTHD